jgi:hypothetical protein
MTPFEIALTIRNRPDDAESVQDFVLRTMARERMSDFHAALGLLIGWERAYEYFERLLDILKRVERKAPDATIEALIKYKRRLGYDPAFEALLARRWRCPHCKQFSTIDSIQLPIGDATRLPRCVTCGEEGVAPIDNEARLDVRRRRQIRTAANMTKTRGRKMANSESRATNPCRVDDGKFVIPCKGLASVGQPITGKKPPRGVVKWTYFTLTGDTLGPSRSFFGVASGAHMAKGICSNYCPFCGTDISAPFATAAHSSKSPTRNSPSPQPPEAG